MCAHVASEIQGLHRKVDLYVLMMKGMLRRQQQQQIATNAKIQRRLWDPGIKIFFGHHLKDKVVVKEWGMIRQWETANTLLLAMLICYALNRSILDEKLLHCRWEATRTFTLSITLYEMRIMVILIIRGCDEYGRYKEVYKAIFNNNDNVDMLYDGQSWKWPKEWVSKYLVLMLKQDIKLEREIEDKTVWVDNKKREVKFSVSRAWK
ncbi:hypothetical protein Tco_0579167 [Tanacetum coccineum]